MTKRYVVIVEHFRNQSSLGATFSTKSKSWVMSASPIWFAPVDTSPTKRTVEIV